MLSEAHIPTRQRIHSIPHLRQHESSHLKHQVVKMVQFAIVAAYRVPLRRDAHVCSSRQSSAETASDVILGELVLRVGEHLSRLTDFDQLPEMEVGGSL